MVQLSSSLSSDDEYDDFFRSALAASANSSIASELPLTKSLDFFLSSWSASTASITFRNNPSLLVGEIWKYKVSHFENK